MQVLLECFRPLRRAHFRRTGVKIVVQIRFVIRSGPYTSLRFLRLMSRDKVHLHPQQSHYCQQKPIAKVLHIQETHSLPFRSSGPGSSVGTATGYGLDGPGIESRWGRIFRTCPGRPWGPPSLLYNGYRVFPGGRKRPGRDADPSPPSSAKV
jgi:hypothetical protein